MPAYFATAALTFVAFAVLIASAWSWLLVAVKAALTWGWLPPPLAARLESILLHAGHSPRLPLVPWTPRRPVPWGFFDLLALIGVWILASLIVSTVLHETGWLGRTTELEKLSVIEQQVALLGDIAIRLLIAAGGLALIALRTSATAQDFGWSWQHLRSDLRLGFIGFVMLGPPVYAMQGLLVWLWKPSKHPLIEMFKGTPDTTLFALLIVSAVIAAPLFEEFVFRMVLQGFLERALSFRGGVHELFFGASRGEVGGSEDSIASLDPLDGPFQERATDTMQPELRGLAAWLPIAVSTVVFALLHFSHGPDWVPLLLLAAGMGYLYQRTHRLLPSLVVHALLNGFSMWGLWVQVREASS